MKKVQKSSFLFISILIITFVCQNAAAESSIGIKLFDYSNCPPPLNMEMIFNHSDTVTAKRKPITDLHRVLKITAKDFIHIYTAPARMDKKSALWTCGILALGAGIYSIDMEIYDALQRNRDDKYYKPIRKVGEFFEPVGYMGHTNLYYFAGLFTGYIFEYEPLYNVCFELLESYLITTALGKNAVHVIVGRKGPSVAHDSHNFVHGPNYGRSFPSGHSMNVMQVANILSHHVQFKPFTIFAYSAASSVLLQRITSDAHWPSDVYFGALFGYLASTRLLERNDARRIKMTPVLLDDGEHVGMTFLMNF